MSHPGATGRLGVTRYDPEASPGEEDGMIRITTRPRRLAIGGVDPVVLEIHPGGLIRVRRKGTRTWYDSTAGALLWQAAKAFALAQAKVKAQERVARRKARRG